MLVRSWKYLILLFLVACQPEEEYKVPENVLSKSDLIPLIIDLQILESHFQRQFARVDLYRDALDSSSTYVFENHNTSKEQLENSIHFYSHYPDTLYVIYEAALDSINFRINQRSIKNNQPVEAKN